MLLGMNFLYSLFVNIEKKSIKKMSRSSYVFFYTEKSSIFYVKYYIIVNLFFVQ